MKTTLNSPGTGHAALAALPPTRSGHAALAALLPCCLISFLIVGTAAAQDPEPTKLPVEGSVTVGYRFTSVKGYQPKFQELFDLESGPRLMDLNLANKGDLGSRFIDNYSLTLSGLGGDPYTTAQLTAHKAHLYDLRISFRQSRYYWNRNDQATLPTGIHGLTSNHDWATVRKLGSFNFLVHASDNLRFSVEYYRNTRNGVNFTTRTLDYFGSSATWGSFARADPYYMIAPLSESANRVTGGVDYTVRDWALHYKVGYQTFDDAVNGKNAITGEVSINTTDPTTAKEPVNSATWSDFRQLKTPISEFSYTGRPARKLETRGGYIFYRYSGPASLDMSMDGIARTNSGGTTDGPYAVSLSSRANVTEPNHVIDQGFTYKPKEWWNILLDYRYSRFSVDSHADFRSVNATVVSQGASSTQWRLGTQTLDFNMAFTPAASLLVRVGVRLLKSDIEALEDGVVDQGRTKRVKTAWPITSIYYQPSKMLTLRGDIEEINNGTSYTRVTPHTDIGGRVFVRFRPTEKFYLEDSVVVRNRKLLESDYKSTMRNNSANATYELNPKFSVFAGFSYDSFFASNFVNFLRGTAPITNIVLRDQTVDRVWQAGFRAAPLPRFGFSFAGNYVRTTGMGEIAGELPLYGPMRFPCATGSLYYDFPLAGRLTAILQRTYYSEQIVSGNDFGAHILTLSWTKNF